MKLTFVSNGKATKREATVAEKAMLKTYQSSEILNEELINDINNATDLQSIKNAIIKRFS